jgi:hypothetical protein
MANKIASVYVIDHNASMLHGSAGNHFDDSIKIVSKILKAKMHLNRKGDHVGVVIVGTDVTRNRINIGEDDGYTGIIDVGLESGQSELLKVPNVELLKYLRDFPRSPPAIEGDILDGIIVGIDVTVH